jgi:NAD-dependent DNA ligase
MKATEQQVASMGGGTFEFIPRTNLEIAVDIAKDTLGSTTSSLVDDLTSFTNFNSMTFDKAIKMVDVGTEVATRIMDMQLSRKMEELNDTIKTTEKLAAEYAEATEKSTLSLHLLAATQSMMFNPMTNNVGTLSSFYDTNYMPAIRLGHIGNTLSTSVIALMGEGADNYINRYYSKRV